MATMPLTHQPRPVPVGRDLPAAGRDLRGLPGALLRAALCASSAPDLDACGVLRTCVAQSRTPPAHRTAV